jgi:NAD(P)-dependent dehydrogenase (short-subunit alcohol dehydrogenase family)
MTQPPQQQTHPGTEAAMDPLADHGQDTYRGSGRLEGKATVITGGDSGIGRAVALAFAREGADVLIAYLEEHEDARATAQLVEDAGRTAVLVSGDVAEPEHCQQIVDRAVDAFGRIDVLVNNAAYQMARQSLDEIPDWEWDHTLATNLSATFRLTRASVPHMAPGSSIINTTSIQEDQPTPMLLPYAATKAAITNLTANLAQLLGPEGIRVNSVAPGPIWTPLIPATMPPEAVESFGDNTPLGRPGQPAEVAPPYVLLASDEGSYLSGSHIAVTGGKPVF